MGRVEVYPLWCLTMHIRGHDLAGECQIQARTAGVAIMDLLSRLTPEEQEAVEYIGASRMYSLDGKRLSKECLT
jgi:hypothetical protein